MSSHSMSIPSQNYDISSFDEDVLTSHFVDVDQFFPQASSQPVLQVYPPTSKVDSSIPMVKFSSSGSESSGTPPRSARSSRASSVDGDAVGGNIDSSTIQHLIEEQNLKKQRLARKAELARITRKRKKERLGELEVEVKRLKSEIDVLRKRNTEILESPPAVGHNLFVDEVVVEEQKNLQRAIEKVVYASSLNVGGTSEQDLPQLVQELMECFSKRTVTSKSHLYSLEASLAPCMPLRFMNWAMCQDDKFYQDPQGLWNCLFKQQLELTDEQMIHILSLRHEMKKQREMGQKVEEVYNKFRPMVEMHLAQTNVNLDRLRGVLSSEQLARFFVWVEQNQLCVKMLESVSN
eukprot:TRINITY_DN5147_c0_g1_i1.p2 TRINITY_DN5147_c0_g1~~TRINITY_DN5147_c0_g1_i1.p2  ORF type:complete len:349 (-),score=86.73 TRINITY_DN5147_c0_g1_i1:1223-2269(-)